MHYPAQPFRPVLVLAFVLGIFLVAHICAWRHFLGVQLYSNYTIGHQNLERVLCLILPCRLVKSVSSTSICIVNLSSESASQGEGCCIIVRDQYLSWGSTAALNSFLPQKSVSRMTRGRSRIKSAIQVKVQMKMIITKPDKVKRLLLLQHDAQVPDEEDQKSWQKWIQATLSKHN